MNKYKWVDSEPGKNTCKKCCFFPENICINSKEHKEAVRQTDKNCNILGFWGYYLYEA